MVSKIITYGFGSYSSVEYVSTFGFDIAELDDSTYTLILPFSLYISQSLSFPFTTQILRM
jgi:hypothetical protein